MATLIQCKGEGQGECTMCKEKYGLTARGLLCCSR